MTTVHLLSTGYLGNRLCTCRPGCAGVNPTLRLSSFWANVSKRASHLTASHLIVMGAAYDARLVDIWACGVVYYCLHFQELPWTVAQPTDHLFAAYASACQTQSSCPPTINNLSPRACRPVIRKMLEPNPKLRALIDELVAHPWVESIEVCHLSPKPSHVHVNAQAMAQAQVQIVS